MPSRPSIPGLRISPGEVLVLATVVLLLALLGGCDRAESPFLPDVPAEATGWSQAMSAWTPGPLDSCSEAIHARYSVVGPDGLRYPTWHPPGGPGAELVS